MQLGLSGNIWDKSFPLFVIKHTRTISLSWSVRYAALPDGRHIVTPTDVVCNKQQQLRKGSINNTQGWAIFKHLAIYHAVLGPDGKTDPCFYKPFFYSASFRHSCTFRNMQTMGVDCPLFSNLLRVRRELLYDLFCRKDPRSHKVCNFSDSFQAHFSPPLDSFIHYQNSKGAIVHPLPNLKVQRAD